jgi:hypothetical protein
MSQWIELSANSALEFSGEFIRPYQKAKAEIAVEL